MKEVETVVTLGDGTIKVEQNGKQIIVESFKFEGSRALVVTLPNVKYKPTEDISPVWRQHYGVLSCWS